MIAAMAVTLPPDVRAAVRRLPLVVLLAAGAAGCAAVPLQAAPTASLRAGPPSVGPSGGSAGSASVAAGAPAAARGSSPAPAAAAPPHTSGAWARGSDGGPPAAA